MGSAIAALGVSASPLILIKTNTERLPRIRNCSTHFMSLPYLFLTILFWIELLLLSPPFHRWENWAKPLLQGPVTWQWAPWLGKYNKYWTPTLTDGIKTAECREAFRLLFSFSSASLLVWLEERQLHVWTNHVWLLIQISHSVFLPWGQRLKWEFLVSALLAISW